MCFFYNEAMQGKANAVADKRLPTTEPRTFDSGFSGKVNLSILNIMVHLHTYLLPSVSVYPIT